MTAKPNTYLFGAGDCICKTSTGATILGTLQEVEVSLDQSIEELRGQYKMPVAIGQSSLKVTGKIKSGEFDINGMSNLFTGDAVTTGQTLLAVGEAQSVPSGSPYTVTVTNAATFVDDYGVRYASSGLPLSLVASSPSAGQYSVDTATGVYTFNASDASAAVKISYTYTSATGYTSTLTNHLMGTQQVFQMTLRENYQDFDATHSVTLVLNRCVMSKLTLPMKNTSFMVSDLEFGCFANSSGDWGTISVS